MLFITGMVLVANNGEVVVEDSNQPCKVEVAMSVCLVLASKVVLASEVVVAPVLSDQPISISMAEVVDVLISNEAWTMVEVASGVLIEQGVLVEALKGIR